MRGISFIDVPWQNELFSVPKKSEFFEPTLFFTFWIIFGIVTNFWFLRNFKVLRNILVLKNFIFMRDFKSTENFTFPQKYVKNSNYANSCKRKKSHSITFRCQTNYSSIFGS